MTRLLSLLFIFALISCKSSIDNNRSITDHYILIFIGAESRKPVDPVDKNVFALEAAYTYIEFRNRGVPEQNIFVLYGGPEPDWSDPVLGRIDQQFKEEFKSSYRNSATVSNLLKTETIIEEKLNAKSVFHLVMNAHGRVDSGGFYMHSEIDRRFIRAEVINEMIGDNKGLTHLFVGSCYSGQLLKEINKGEGLLITGSNNKGSCWLDREGSFGRIYFSMLPKDLSFSKYPQSFKPARDRYIAWGAEKKKFIFEDYKTTRKDELESIVWDPQLKVLK